LDLSTRHVAGPGGPIFNRSRGLVPVLLEAQHLYPNLVDSVLRRDGMVSAFGRISLSFDDSGRSAPNGPSPEGKCAQRARVEPATLTEPGRVGGAAPTKSSELPTIPPLEPLPPGRWHRRHELV